MVCKSSGWYVFLALVVVLGIGLAGCSKSGGLGTLPPIFPATEIPADAGDIVIDREVTPAAIEATKDDITVVAQYIRKYDLDRKFNRGSMTSPFFYREAWHQGEKTDVFYVKITNNRSKPIIFDIKKCVLKDNTSGGEYVALTGDENAERLLYKTGRDIKINNGLIKAREILLQYQVADNEIGPGQSIEGYVPFRMIASRATKVDLIISLDRAPDTAIGRYKVTTFVLPFEHDLAVRHAQPAALSF